MVAAEATVAPEPIREALQLGAETEEILEPLRLLELNQQGVEALPPWPT
jgi:hypothetical protein